MHGKKIPLNVSSQTNSVETGSSWWRACGKVLIERKQKAPCSAHPCHIKNIACLQSVLSESLWFHHFGSTSIGSSVHEPLTLAGNKELIPNRQQQRSRVACREAFSQHRLPCSWILKPSPLSHNKRTFFFRRNNNLHKRSRLNRRILRNRRSFERIELFFPTMP